MEYYITPNSAWMQIRVRLHYSLHLGAGLHPAIFPCSANRIVIRPALRREPRLSKWYNTWEPVRVTSGSMKRDFKAYMNLLRPGGRHRYRSNILGAPDLPCKPYSRVTAWFRRRSTVEEHPQ